MSAYSSPIYFISDLHLEHSRTDIAKAFAHFMQETAKDAQAIYILGDLFDAWIGDDNNAKFIRQMKKIMKDTSDRGVALYFLHGNRDFLIGDQFAKDIGATLLDEHSLIDLFGEKVLLLHGDTLCTSDEAYQAFRKRVHTQEWQQNILAKPLWVRKLIAAYIRARSRRANKNKTTQIMDVTPEMVDEIFLKYDTRKMIHGHTHRPKKHQLDINNQTCERIVLGDWEKFGWYLRADKNGQELIQFTIN